MYERLCIYIYIYIYKLFDDKSIHNDAYKHLHKYTDMFVIILVILICRL
jgi:hypothetical protein